MKELLYGMVFFKKVKDPFDLTKWITRVLSYGGILWKISSQEDFK